MSEFRDTWALICIIICVGIAQHTVAIETSSFQKLIKPAVGRRLQASSTSATQCIWVNDACYLHSDYVTSLTGTPTTESQKLLARISAMENICSNYSTSSTCLARPSEFCFWSGSECGLSTAFVATEWFYNRMICPGSLMDKAITCFRLASQSTCTANNNCAWEANVTYFDDFAIATLAGYIEQMFGASSTSCTPTWFVNNSTLTNLISKLQESITSGTNPIAAIFSELMGTCSGVTNFKDLLTTCLTATTRSACESKPGCEYSSADSSCMIAADSVITLLLDPKDTWVVSVNNASDQCLALNVTTCENFANITTNTTRYTDFIRLQPNFDTPAGGFASQNMPPAAILSLGLVLSVLHHFLFGKLF